MNFIMSKGGKYQRTVPVKDQIEVQSLVDHIKLVQTANLTLQG